MINVNFFRKEAKNILPLILVIIFLLGAGAIAAEVYLSRSYYENELKQDQAWLEENTAELNLSREMKQVDQWISQAVEVQDQLRQDQYPMYQLTDKLAALIPEEDMRVTSFQLSETSEQVSLVLENTRTDEALAIITDLEAQPYVDVVQVLSANLQNQENEEFSFQLIIELNLEALAGEDAK
ncbi:MAG: hypothetical protein WCR98_08660 [Saccharofermentanales bacterium]|nr:hypothetical protein [Fastidiosipila sp.]